MSAQTPTTDEATQLAIRSYRGIELGLGQADPVAAIATNPTYDDARKKPLLEVTDSKVLAEALKKAGIEPAEAKKTAEADKAKSQKAAEDLKIAIETKWRAQLFQAVRVKFGERFAATKLLAAEELTLLAVMLFERLAEWGGEFDALMATWGHPVNEELDEQDQIDTFIRHITTLDAPALCLFLTDIALIDETGVNRYALLNHGDRPENLLAQAKRLNIDADALRKAVEAEHKAAASKTKGKPAKAAKPASTPVDAARAGDKGATAAPAGVETGTAAEAPKKAAPKKTKAKADPAPAKPANAKVSGAGTASAGLTG